MTELEKEELNKTVRLESWNQIVNQVKNNQINFDSFHWKNAVAYLVKDIEFKISREEFNDYQEQASGIVKDELKKEMNSLTATREERSRATIMFADLLDNNFKDSDLNSRVATVRQKLVVREYILSNCVTLDM